MAFVISAWGVLCPLLRYGIARDTANQSVLDAHHRFWGDEPAMRGLLIHHAGGRGGSTWTFEWKGGTKDEQEEEGFRFGDHPFKVGEYVSVREEDGELLTFRVVGVGQP